MSYRAFVSMNIAIIGDGETAELYAVGFACAGHQVHMACREDSGERISDWLASFNNVQVCSIEQAADIADLIIIATAPKHVREVAYWLGDVRNKVIVDATSNVHAADEELVKTICAIQSITGSVHIVKAFNARGYEQILKPLFRDQKVELILMGDSIKAKEIMKILAVELGINYSFDFGGNENVLIFNEMTKCWRNLKQVSTPVLAPVRVLKH